MISTVVIVLTLVVAVYGHACKDVKLSAADQSVIDMMEHYLHTSRKTECSDNKLDGGAVYVRWGRKDCPEGANIVYSGQAGGNHYKNKGGGSNYLCLPNDPDNGKPFSFANDVLYGVEYEPYSLPAGFPNLRQKEASCAVCRRKGKSSTLMIPGKQTCYSGWKVEYTGFLMTSYKTLNNQDYVCMDKDSEPIDNNTKNNDEGLIYPVRTTCGSLRCPPYKNHTEMLCVVCTI